jgi:hypothetical protein
MPKPQIPEGLTRQIWMAVTSRKGMSEGEQYALWRLVDDKIKPTGPSHDRRLENRVQPTFPQEVLAMRFTEELRTYLAEFYPTQEEQKRYVKEMCALVKTFRPRGKRPAELNDPERQGA